MRSTLRKTARRFPGTVGRRSLSFNIVPVVMALAISWPLIGNHGAKIQMQSTRLTPAAKGTLHIKRNAKNRTTQLNMKVKHLAPAATLSSSKNDYVVWLKPANHPLKKEGVLNVKSDRSAQFKTSTPYQHFQIFVTAENSPSVQAPHGKKVLTAEYPAS